MRFHIITLFPTAFDSYLGESILKRAIAEKNISVIFYNPRDYVQAGKKVKLKIGDPGYFRETSVDSKPYAGGPGMVVQAEPVIKAVEAAMKSIKPKVRKVYKVGIVWLTP